MMADELGGAFDGPGFPDLSHLGIRLDGDAFGFGGPQATGAPGNGALADQASSGSGEQLSAGKSVSAGVSPVDAQPPVIASDFDPDALMANLRRLQEEEESQAASGTRPAAQLQGNAFAEFAKAAQSDENVMRFFKANGGDVAAANKAMAALAQHRGSRSAGLSQPDAAKTDASLPSDIGALDCTVYVQYLPVTMREIELMDLICQFGAPKRIRVCGNPKKEHNWTYGFVEYGSPEEAAKFIRECDGMRAGNFRMRCNIAKTPIVDRLAIDAPADGVCTFAQKFPNRTLRELILASIAVSDDPPAAMQQQHEDPSAPSRVAGGGTSILEAARASALAPAWLAVPEDLGQHLAAAVKEAAAFASERSQSCFFKAKKTLTAVMEAARTRMAQLPPERALAVLLNGTDVVFLCRLLLTVLHVIHRSESEALAHALAALQSMPTTVAVLTHIQRIDNDATYAATPRGFTPLLLNHLVSFGLLLEPISIVAARAFYHTAQHRATVHGLRTSKALQDVLGSNVVPVAHATTHGKAGQQPSLLRATFPLLCTQDHGFASFLLSNLEKGGCISSSCVGIFNPPSAASQAPSNSTSASAGSPNNNAASNGNGAAEPSARPSMGAGFGEAGRFGNAMW